MILNKYPIFVDEINTFRSDQFNKSTNIYNWKYENE